MTWDLGSIMDPARRLNVIVYDDKGGRKRPILNSVAGLDTLAMQHLHKNKYNIVYSYLDPSKG